MISQTEIRTKLNGHDYIIHTTITDAIKPVPLTKKVSDGWEVAVDKIIQKWYPQLSPKEHYVLKQAIYEIHGLVHNAASCKEVTFKILHDSIGLLTEENEITKIIDTLSDKFIVEPLMVDMTKDIYFTDAKTTHLRLDNKFQHEAICAMNEVTMSDFWPRRMRKTD